MLLLFLDCSTLPSIRTLYCWVLSNETSSSIFKVFGVTQPRIEPRSPGPLANTQDEYELNSTSTILLKHESKISFTRWRRTLLWHCCWCSIRGYICSISVHSLPRLRTSNLDWSNERKLLTLKKTWSWRYSLQTITSADYADDIVLLITTPTQAESLLHSLEPLAGGIALHVNPDKTEHMSFHKKGDISTLNGGSLKQGDKFTYLGSSVSSTENDINLRLAKAWTAIDSLSIVWNADLSDKMKRNFFQAAVVSILLYGRWLSV